MTEPRSTSSSDEPPAICPLCPREFSRARDLKRHMVEYHGPSKDCPLGCNYTTRRRYRLQKHLMKKHNMRKTDAIALAISNIMMQSDSPTTVRRYDGSNRITCHDIPQTDDLVGNNGLQNVDTASPRVATLVNANKMHPIYMEGVQQVHNQFDLELPIQYTYTEMLENGEEYSAEMLYDEETDWTEMSKNGDTD